MPDIGYVPQTHVDTAPRRVWTGGRAVLLAAILAGAALAALATPADQAAQAARAAGPDLTRLLRAMAALKLLVAAALLAATWWRLALPTPPWRLAGYATAAAAMTAGPILIWQMQHVASGALLLHAGLLTTLLLLWRDQTLAHQLATLVATRRAKPQPSRP